MFGFRHSLESRQRSGVLSAPFFYIVLQVPLVQHNEGQAILTRGKHSIHRPKLFVPAIKSKMRR